ncbi:hypothetical protein CBS101457_006042 [Exobasidium rhododendri]|nr:hypothetical protein CBS101457_006042 [Exobasidium rhododendri]
MESGFTTPNSEQEKQQLHSQDAVTRRSHKKRNIIIAVVVTLVIVIALAVGLGVGLTRNRSKAATDTLPSLGEDASEAGLHQSGQYFTSYSDSDSQFEWTESNFTLTSGSPSASSVNPTILLNNTTPRQAMDGFGASLTDSAASLFATLKTDNITTYNSVMQYLFNQRTGLNILRVPIGTSDFSPESLQYTMADRQGVQANVNDTQGPLTFFNLNGSSTFILPFLKDALAINKDLKISLLPWSPPAWMKSNKSVNGGSLQNGATGVLAEYLVKTVQGFQSELGVTPWALSVQNEPSNPTAYPSMSMTNDYEIPVLAILRGRLAEVGLGGVKLFGHEDNYAGYSDAAALVSYNESSLDGISWHCYNGSSSLLGSYDNALVNVTNSAKSQHMTECSGQDVVGSASSTSLKWWMNNIFSQPRQGISSIVVWNLALDSDSGPRLKRAYCTDCAGSIQIDGAAIKSSLHGLLLSHHATAASDLTRFGGSAASRIDTGVSGDTNNCIVSTLAFQASWNSSSTERYGLVVQNNCSTSVATTVSLNNQRNFDVTVGNGVTTIVLTA